jgi:hypothetical protein
MEIIVLSGGLGNQMFQYAFYLSKKVHNNNIAINDYSIRRESTHNGYELEKVFNISIKRGIVKDYFVAFFRKILISQKYACFKKTSLFILKITNLIGIRIVLENNLGKYNETLTEKMNGFCLYFGFWQSEKYFLPIKYIISNAFSFNINNISKKTLELLKLVEYKESISIHVRRGDYLLDEHKNMYADICSFEYYRKAISIVNNHLVSPLFVIFSDDIKWVKEMMEIGNSIFVDWNVNADSWQDMFLMSKCKHNIIANSTFSWWAAWLNNNPQKIVISPKKFINNIETPDLIPESWITI